MRGYFEGWYFKQQTGSKTIAIIPAVHADNGGKKSASIQVITDGFAKMAEYSPQEFFADRGRVEIRVGESVFSRRGLKLNINKDELRAEGQLTFGKPAPPRYDIMGPFAIIPFMECRHSLLSLSHTVDGSLRIDGEETEFRGGAGYMEGDRGRSFPKRYIWTQCSFGERDSLMLSVADIPFMGGMFTGVIGAVLFGGREYRIATYLGARVASIGNEAVSVRQGNLRFTAELLKTREQRLRAPVMGGMTRFVRESASCRAGYRLEIGGRVIFDIESDSAGFEFEWR
ncbi:MAG: tocopherol cyclase family protein [Oscillospiraceae bacterium]